MISVLNAYYWNNKYVFKGNAPNNIPKKILKVYVSYGSTFLLSTFLLFLMVDVWSMSEYIAPLIQLKPVFIPALYRVCQNILLHLLTCVLQFH